MFVVVDGKIEDDEHAYNVHHGHIDYGEDDIRVVVDVLGSDWLTQGPLIREFEKALCDKLGSPYASVLTNGTAALHLTGLALGWKAGDIVLTTPTTFLATANSILYAGATPQFVDIDPVTYVMDPARLEERITRLDAEGKRVKAVIAVDFAGHPCDWQALRSLADQHGFQLVNDACHALGAKYKEDAKYAVKFADAVTLSFHPVKHITTGEGGAVLTRDGEIDNKIKRLASHGVIRGDSPENNENGPWYYEMRDLGFNYRITDFQCALGISQLKKLDEFVEARRCIARYYDKAFGEDERFVAPQISEGVSHAYHLYPLQVMFENVKLSKKDFFSKLREKRINCQVHYIPVHLQPFYRDCFGFKAGDFPVAETFYAREVSIPMYPSLKESDLEAITKSIIEVIS